MEDSPLEPVTENIITKRKAFKICAEYLGGRWKSITSSEMVFKPVSGGLINFLYYCSLPETEHPRPSGTTEPSQVLLRIYGQAKDQDGIINETVIFTILSERKMGPKLYGVFPGGRLEEYIPSRTLFCADTRIAQVSLVIAKKLAQVHTLQVPICKESTRLFILLREWTDYARNYIEIDKFQKEQQAIAQKILQIDFESEITWLESFVEETPSPIVFCHNDLQGGNMLVKEGSKEVTEDNLVFIDYEFANYTFRGCDIASHFSERIFDYKAQETYPYFKRKLSDYPSEEEQLKFIRAYFSAIQESACSDSLKTNLLVSEEHILREIKVHTLAVSLTGVLWSAKFCNSSIPFGHWEHALARMDVYYKFKSSLGKINGEEITLDYKE